jgi:hypothetical protein
MTYKRQTSDEIEHSELIDLYIFVHYRSLR